MVSDHGPSPGAPLPSGGFAAPGGGQRPPLDDEIFGHEHVGVVDVGIAASF